MATQVIVPILGESIQTATLVSWSKKVGDQVKRGDEIAEVETDKANMSLECPENGVVLAILIPAGQQVQTGDLLAWIGKPGESIPETPSPEPAAQVAESATRPPHLPQPEIESSRGRISPAARKMAKSLGISPDHLQPARPGLRITTDDVQRFVAMQKAQLSAQPAAPVSGQLTGRVEPLNAVRRMTGARMLASVQQIPQYSVTVEADASRLLAVVTGLNRDANAGDKITLTALLVYLTAWALQKNPHVNASFLDDNLFIYDHVNIAIAVNTPRGLVAPVLSSVGSLSLREVASRLNRLVEKARGGILNQADLEGGTFTLSNLGPQGVSQFSPIIIPPQAAILGVGSARPMIVPAATGGTRLIQSMALTLTADHRVLDGAEVGKFLNDLRHEVESYGDY